MSKVFGLIRRLPLGITLAVIFGGYVLFDLLGDIGNGAAGGTAWVFHLILFWGLLAALVVAAFINNARAVKALGVAVFCMFALNFVISGLPSGINGLASSVWTDVVYGIFFLFAFICGAGILVLYVLSLFVPSIGENDTVRLVTRILALVLGCAYLVALLFHFIGMCINPDWYNWGQHMYNVSSIFFICGILFGYVRLLDRE